MTTLLRRRAYRAFDPRMLGNLEVWLDANHMPGKVTDALVTPIWPDLSGHGNDYKNISTAAWEPSLRTNRQNLNPGVHFQTKALERTFVRPFTESALTSIMVLKAHTFPGSGRHWCFRNTANTNDYNNLNGFLVYSDGTSANWTWHRNSVKGTDGTIVAGTAFIATMRWLTGTNNSGMWTNKTKTQTFTHSNAFSINHSYLGVGWVSGALSATDNADIYEAMFFRRALDDGELDVIWNYLIDKWAIV